MPPRHINYIQYRTTGYCLDILVEDGEQQNRETIRNFILTVHGVDVGDRNYTLWFLDNAGIFHQVDPASTIRRAFDVARTTLNGQEIVYLSVWNQCGLKFSNWILKSEVKEENF